MWSTKWWMKYQCLSKYMTCSKLPKIPQKLVNPCQKFFRYLPLLVYKLSHSWKDHWKQLKRNQNIRTIEALLQDLQIEEESRKWDKLEGEEINKIKILQEKVHMIDKKKRRNKRRKWRIRKSFRIWKTNIFIKIRETTILGQRTDLEGELNMKGLEAHVLFVEMWAIWPNYVTFEKDRKKKK